MKKLHRPSAIFCLLLISLMVNAQKQTSKWYFGAYAGLDFTTTPPTILTNGMLNTSEGCESISDAAGNLVLYTDGTSLFDKNHNPMMNGSGLTGNSSTTQSGIIIKQPGNSNIYFVFTLGASGNGSLACSTVDMNLSAGMGSVTVKNTMLATGMSEKLTSVQHCNGRDIWVIAHKNNSSDFMSYLVSATGVNTTAVISTIGSVFTSQNFMWAGNMKVSPNGRKLAMAMEGPTGSFEVFDFDNASGIISNPLNLGSFPFAYGCEFSPDGNVLYGGREMGTDFLLLHQWNLCAGSPTAIAASLFTLSIPSQIMGMQLALDGKIYIARGSQSDLAVINAPNLVGAACNYVHAGQSVAPKMSKFNLPNFMTSYFRPAPQPFTHTISCNTASFSPPAISNTLNVGCGSIINTATNVLWTFDDPASGTYNSSTQLNPSHAFTSPGTYSVKLVSYSQCSSDTIWSTVTISAAAPNIQVAGNFSLCSGETKTYTVSGGSSYTWQNGSTTTTISLSPATTSTYSVIGTNSNSCSGRVQFTMTVSKCTGMELLNLDNYSVKIYPNPTTGHFYVETQAPIQLFIYNALGKAISEFSFESGVFKLDLSDYESGIYTIKSISQGRTQMLRLLKEGPL